MSILSIDITETNSKCARPTHTPMQTHEHFNTHTHTHILYFTRADKYPRTHPHTNQRTHRHTDRPQHTDTQTFVLFDSHYICPENNIVNLFLRFHSAPFLH